MNTFEELKAAVEANQNVLSLKMETLRDIFGVRRLGIHRAHGDLTQTQRSRTRHLPRGP